MVKRSNCTVLPSSHSACPYSNLGRYSFVAGDSSFALDSGSERKITRAKRVPHGFAANVHGHV